MPWAVARRHPHTLLQWLGNYLALCQKSYTHQAFPPYCNHWFHYYSSGVLVDSGQTAWSVFEKLDPGTVRTPCKSYLASWCHFNKVEHYLAYNSWTNLVSQNNFSPIPWLQRNKKALGAKTFAGVDFPQFLNLLKNITPPSVFISLLETWYISCTYEVI